MTQLGETPWVDKTWRKVWDRATARVDESWLPDVHEGKKLRVHEHGAGHWGVVSPTNEPGVVVKLTSDPSEALFVAWALSVDRPEAGIVEYFHIYEVTGVTHRARKVYMLWRSEAYDVGALLVDWRAAVHAPRAWVRRANNAVEEEHRLKTLDGAGAVLGVFQHAGTLRKHLLEMRRICAAQGREAEYTRILGLAWDSFNGGDTGYFAIDDIAREIHAVRRAMEETSSTHYVAGVGKAMLHYLLDGVALCDVHLQNLGRSMPGGPWIITDPGHSLVLNPAVVIPPIEPL